MGKVKSALIVFLFLLMIGLMFLNIRIVINGTGLSYARETESPERMLLRRSVPCLCAISGIRGTEVSCGGGLPELFEKIQPVYSEALATLDAPEKTDRRPEGELIYVRFMSFLPLELLSSWEGGKYEGPEYAVSLSAVAESGEVSLFIETAEGVFLKASTKASPARLAEICRSAEPNGYWEGSFPVPADGDTLPAYSLSPAVSDGVTRKLAEAFYLNPSRMSFYESYDGTLNYVDGMDTLSVSKDGGLIYSSENGIPLGDEKNAVEKAAAILSDVWEAAGASGEPSFNCEKNGRLYFDLSVNGVFLTGEWAATADIKDGCIVKICAYPLKLRSSGEEIRLFPAFYLLPATDGKNPVISCYVRTGSSLIPDIFEAEAGHAVE